MGHAPPKPRKPRVKPAPPSVSWADEVRELYVRSPNMEVEEFERLMGDALRGLRPDHPGLPMFPPPSYNPLPGEPDEPY